MNNANAVSNPASVGGLVDLDKRPVAEVLAALDVKADGGLSNAEAEQRLAQCGPNALVEKQKGLLAKLLGPFMGPIAYMIEAAALVSALLGRWNDFAVIFGLLVFNAALGFWQERKASNALAALKNSLAPEATALREGQWQTVRASTLVPGDIVKIRLGVIVPADLRLVSGDYAAAIDQAALTGESLPANKKVGDAAYSGSVVKEGEMEGVDILCSDKTGTLTKNVLTLADPILFTSTDPQEVVLSGALASKIEDRDAIDTAVIGALQDQGALSAYKQIKYKPFDPVGKRTQAEVPTPDGKSMLVSKGAPQVIAALANLGDADAAKVKQALEDLGTKGYRALGVARSGVDGKTWSLLGILPMFDPPRDDSKTTIDEAALKGVRVKMVTGDDTAIARETARQLGLGTHITPAAEAFPKDMDPNNVPPDIAEAIERADGFARVFPEHKYSIVKALQDRGHLVAMTGDGVNDAPALKQAYTLVWVFLMDVIKRATYALADHKTEWQAKHRPAVNQQLGA